MPIPVMLGRKVKAATKRSKMMASEKFKAVQLKSVAWSRQWLEPLAGSRSRIYLFDMGSGRHSRSILEAGEIGL